ncbi:acyl-CoA thioester hydrolase, YbgC/YbaW family [Sinosporangium album]|uniref:Acyl-CoA thioester hydrolase, YbgC/YbaW family n=1 Tax=Sinosporangium album TaxID=504805 RepID=A0A1G7ZV42_9ACTN|nr:thioesterase family protein [Sinosporangium album]SDH12522.1 acyl-CoA thioester hydrolase, YbgC/YbaW family [Sinosporangium album]
MSDTAAKLTRTRQRVAMTDVDLVQINFRAYFRWMDHAYMQILIDLGHPLSRLLEAGSATPAVDARCNYRRPVSLDDEVDVLSWISTVGTSSYEVTHAFTHRRDLVAIGSVKHVWIGLDDARPLPVPGWLRDALVTAPDASAAPGRDDPLGVVMRVRRILTSTEQGVDTWRAP